MPAARLLALPLVALAPATVVASGLARNENFVVFAPDSELAEAVLRQADLFRHQLAREWFSHPLPSGAGRTVINVRFSATEDRAFTWPKLQSGRSFHWIWLGTSPERLLGSTLRHEITHAVLATRFPTGLPPWADEGIASLSDNPQRMAARQDIIDAYAATDRWPDLRSVFDQATISAADRDAYSVAASIVQYLTTRGDKPTVLDFANRGKRAGWDGAVQSCYAFASVEDLERHWRTWAKQNARVAAAQATGDRPRSAQLSLTQRR